MFLLPAWLPLPCVQMVDVPHHVIFYVLFCCSVGSLPSCGEAGPLWLDRSKEVGAAHLKLSLDAVHFSCLLSCAVVADKSSLM